MDRDYQVEGTAVRTRQISKSESVPRLRGLAYDTIAERLNAEDIPARAGRWHATSVSRVLKANS
jgi:hypothetical protein